LNNAALAGASTDAVDSYAAAAAPYAASQATFTFPNASENVFNVGNRVRIAAQAASTRFVADTLAEGTGHTAYTDGVSDQATVTAKPSATTITVTGVFAVTDAASTISAADDFDHSAVAALSTTTCTIYLARSLAAGDVISWSTANAYAQAGVVVVPGSITVGAVASTSYPTVAVTCLTGGVNTVWLEFDQPVQGLVAGEITNNSDETVGSVKLIPGTNIHAVTMNNAMESGDTITVAASAVTGQNGIAGPLLATTGTCANAPTKPSMVSATAVESVTTASACVMDGGNEDVTFTWSKTGIGKGIRGNAYKIQTVDSNSGTAAVTTTYNASTKTLVVGIDDGGALDPSTTSIAVAINADPTYGPNGTAIVSASAGNAYSTASTTTCASGVSSITATVKFNSKMSVLAASIDPAEILISDTTGLAYQALANDPIATRAAEALAWNSNTIKMTWTPLIANVLTSTSKIRMDAAAFKTHNLIGNTAAQTIAIG
jgi:hypothetical protein